MNKLLCLIRHSNSLSRGLSGRFLVTRSTPAITSAVENGRIVLDAGLSEHDHVLQVYGSNTDVGKTVISTGLLRAAAHKGLDASYIKPVQTGFPSDASFVSSHAPTCRNITLFEYTDPVSPHVAAARDGVTTSDTKMLDTLVQEIKFALGRKESLREGQCTLTTSDGGKRSRGNLILVETAGGVLSPAPSGKLQADAFRPLRLPVVLVGDGRLGGIGATLSSLESLKVRGYSVLGVILTAQEEELGNAQAIARHTGSVPVFELPPLPPREEPLEPWYVSNNENFSSILETLQERRAESVRNVVRMKERGRNALWWPFTQHDDLAAGDITVIDSAYGDYFCTSEVDNTVDSKPRASNRALLDACASWWTHGAGHGNPGMALSIAEAAGRYGHVIFPRNVHAPALESNSPIVRAYPPGIWVRDKVAERLVNGPGREWASRVFYTDNGSTATEVGIKMGFRRFLKDRFKSSEPPVDTELAVVAQYGCYHGDTLGAMNVAVPSVFNRGQHAWYQAHGLFLDTPSISWRDGRFTVELPVTMRKSSKISLSTLEAELVMTSRDAAFDYEARNAGRLAMFYQDYMRSKMEEFEADGKVILGSLMLEPLLMGAGGMILVDPLFQRLLVQECRARGMPIIYDEVFSGLWRLGVESTRDLLGENPDISCYAKLLTGGVVPMSATIATERVFESFSGTKADCLLHGHSYTAHPVGCAAAIEYFSQLEKSELYPGVGGRMRDVWDEDVVERLSLLPAVDRTFSLGSVLALEMKAADRGYDSNAAVEVANKLLERGDMYARVLGNVIYVIVSPMTPAEACQSIISTMESIIRSVP